VWQYNVVRNKNRLSSYRKTLIGGIMKQGFSSMHFNDENGNPAGGTSYGVGFAIGWQNGPLGRGENRIEPNGAFVEDIIDVAADRIRYYQESPFNCKQNANALKHLELALEELNDRTADREERDVEGTHNK
jgi:hypothetical protein